MILCSIVAHGKIRVPGLTEVLISTGLNNPCWSGSVELVGLEQKKLKKEVHHSLNSTKPSPYAMLPVPRDQSIGIGKYADSKSCQNF
jgi:hypothetical protein